MKKNRMMRLASILLVCVLLTTSVISGTYAKYISTASGDDTARVAKWSIEVNGTDIAVSNPEITFDLFNTVLDTVDGKKERNVLEGVSETIIAPGTKGSFELAIDNTSEVTAKYAIDFSVLSNSKNIPIQYSINNTDWSMDINNIDIAASDATQIDMVDGKATVKVYWKWAFESDLVSAAFQSDDKDTALGIAADDDTSAPAITIQATITATQVD